MIYLDVIILVIGHVNIIMHSSGSFFLICTYKKERQKVQKLYLIHLCLVEATKNLLLVMVLYVKYIDSASLKDFQHILFIIIDMLKILYYLFMNYITTDRMFAILLNYKYPLYWRVRNAKCLLMVSWILCIVLIVCISLVNSFTGYDYHPYNAYVYLFFDIVFIVIALFTYCFMFNKYKNSLARKIRKISMVNCGYPESFFTVFRQSNFYIPFLLITSFLLFMVIPDLIYTTNGVVCVTISHPVLLHICTILYTFNDFTDACVYTVMQKKARKMMIKKLKCLVFCCYRNEGKLLRRNVLFNHQGTQILLVNQGRT